MQSDQKIITLILLTFFIFLIVILVSLEIKIEAQTMAGETRFTSPASSSQCRAFRPTEWRSYWTYSSFAARTRSITFPYYSQKDSRFSNNPYGYSDVRARERTDISRSGCGVVSAAMILRYYGICTDPSLVAKYSLSNGHRYNGYGTSASLFPALATKYRLKYANTGLRGETREQKWDFVFAWALQGYPIIASVRNHTFTNDSHYIVITGMDRNGNLIIADPNSEMDTRRATFNEIKSWLNHAHVIYKK